MDEREHEARQSLLVDIASRKKPSEQFAQIREEYSSYALTTKKADRARLEEAIHRIYAASSLFENAPKMIWLSPCQFLITAFILRQEFVTIDGITPLSSCLSNDCQLTRYLNQFINDIEKRSGTYFPNAVRRALDRTARFDWSGMESNSLWTTIILELIRNSSLTDDQVRSAFGPPSGNSAVWYAIVPDLIESALEETISAGPEAARASAIMQHAAEISKANPLWIKIAGFLRLAVDEVEKLERHAIHSPLTDGQELAKIAALRNMGYDIHYDESYLEALKSGGWWLPFDEICLLCDNPIKLHLDDRGRLHNQHGAAIAFEDGKESFYVQGFRVPKSLIDGTMDSHEIDAVSNIELRRIMIETIGLDKYLQNSDLEKVHEDNYGTLYLKRVQFDEPMMVLKVINSTKEPDGSRKEYFLRVPPDMVTAREAAAWTFGLSGREYNPSRET